jgi:hypothetical protein
MTARSGSAASRSPIDEVLSRLEGVRAAGPGKWSARCPAHDDDRPSLWVYENADGMVGLTCFAECSALDVIDAIGLDWGDLFAEKLRPTKSTTEPRRSTMPRMTAAECLRQLDDEALAVELAAYRISRGEGDFGEWAERLEQAARRIATIRTLARLH